MADPRPWWCIAFVSAMYLLGGIIGISRSVDREFLSAPSYPVFLLSLFFAVLLFYFISKGSSLVIAPHIILDSGACTTSDVSAGPNAFMCDLLSAFFTSLFNKSLDTGCFPTEFKQAVVRPLLKKNGLDDSALKNFRPVSNLSFISKLLETHIQALYGSNGLMLRMLSC